MKAIRPDIAALEQNGITRVALPRLGDPTVIPLWFGEGDEVTPANIRDAAKNALDEGVTFYDHTRGSACLRSAVRDYCAHLYDVELHPDRVSIPGSSMIGVTIAAQMALTTGDEALIVAPYWPNIETTCRIAGADVRIVRQQETPEGWQLSADEIIAGLTPKTRLLYVNSPCNPTGWVMSREEQGKILEACRERNILLLADEVYHRHVFGMPVAPSFIEIARDDDPVVVVNGFSKAWAMTGWRVGWVVAPREQATHWALMSECFNTGATVFAQQAAITALRDNEDDVLRLKAQYEEGGRIVQAVLGRSNRIQLSPPKGAFYAFPRISGIESSYDFANNLLAARDVGVAPGYTFGPGNEAHIRVCFALSHDRLREGLNRLVDFVEEMD